MKKALCIALLAALTLPLAAAEPTETEYLVDLTSEEVYALEQRLYELGFLSGGYDEVFDADTRLAIESFQQANGLEVNGVPDGVLRDRLNSETALSRQDYLRRFADAYAQMPPLSKGNINGDVLMMQRRLKECDYFTGECDGVFGEATQMAVESFQMANGLTASGVADGSTLMRLMADSPISWPAFLSEMSATAGDIGLNVYVLQKRLRQMGYFEGECTGSFGDLTQQAVMRFQTENQLEPTGVADGATWAAIYSGAAVAPRREDVLQIGDFGESIQQMQRRLNALGFFDHEVTGEFDYVTETAVRLFQMAAELSVTGEVDAETMRLMMADGAPDMKDQRIQQAFSDELEHPGPQSHAAVAEIASRMPGTAFGEVDDGLYPGFSFVQYVCVTAGLPVTSAEDLIRLASAQVDDAEQVEAGDVVAFQNASGDAVRILMTIGAGDGKVIYPTATGGWVVVSFLDQMSATNVFRWDAGQGAGA